MKKQLGLSLLMTMILTSCIQSPETSNAVSSGGLTPDSAGKRDDESEKKEDDSGGGLKPAAIYKFSFNSRLISSHEQEFFKSQTTWDEVGLAGSLSAGSSASKFKIKLFKLANERQHHNVCDLFGITRDGSKECECDVVATNNGQILKVEKEAEQGQFSVHVVPTSAITAECEPDGEGDAPAEEPSQDPTMMLTQQIPSVTVRCGDIEKELKLGANVHIDY